MASTVVSPLAAGSLLFAAAPVAEANPVGDVGSSAALALDARGAGIAIGNAKAVWWKAGERGLGDSVGTTRFAWKEKRFDPHVSWSPSGGALACTPAGVIRYVPAPTDAFEAAQSPVGWEWDRIAGCATLEGTFVATLAFAPGAGESATGVEGGPVALETPEGPWLRIARGPEPVASFDLRPWGFRTAADLRDARLVAKPGAEGSVDGFWLVAPQGRLFLASAEGPWTFREVAEASGARPLPLERTTALAAHGNTLLRAGEDGVFLYTGDFGAGAAAGNTLVRTRLPVNPCAEEERCGASLAPDGSWLVCGSWGCSLGRGVQARRVPLPALGEETGTLSLVHTGESGRFAYFGVRDADVGTLPAAFESPKGGGETSAPSGVRGPRPHSGEPHDARRKASETPRDTMAGWTKPTFATPAAALADAATRVASKHVLFPYREAGGWGAVVVVPASVQESGSPREDVRAFLSAWEPPRAFAPPRFNGKGTSPRGALGEGPWEEATLWWRETLRLDETLALLAGRGRALESVNVGVVDSGVDTSHPALDGLLSPDGYDFVEEDDVPDDGFGHGTHVASLIASRVPAGAPRAGLPLGVAPNARLIIARALDDGGRSDSLGLARALAHVVKKGARIVNCSWGGGPETQLLRDAFAHLEEEGVFVASSAGNDGLDTDAYPQVPKKFPGVVNTAALTPSGRRARFSNFGKASVFLYAPGEDVLAALPGGGLGGKSGTSMASPLTAGTAALLLGAGASRASAKAFLCEGARREGELARSSQCGRLDAYGAVERLLLANVVEPYAR